MTSLCRLLPFRIANGPWNMAADDALLETAAGGVASLRFYGWSEPTLSLGYFQPAAPARGLGRLGELAWLRRPSGGSALVHHHEITYAIALPFGPIYQPSRLSLLIRMHQFIQTALAELGIDTRLCETEQKYGEVLCFLHHTPGDLLLGTSKVVGSAQRKQRGAVLQHGGILLARSPFTLSLPGIAELSGRAIEPAELQAVLVEIVGREMGWSIRADDWTAAEQERITSRIHFRYRSPGWNEKR